MGQMRQVWRLPSNSGQKGNFFMSMPQNLIVAIVCSDPLKLIFYESKLNLPEDGINPRYYFVTPDDDLNKIINPKNYPYAFVKLWIALDTNSLIFAKKKDSANKCNKNYSRGFYDDLLPESVIYINEKLSGEQVIENLKKTTDTILKAFYETS
jgi:hypothetical protein